MNVRELKERFGLTCFAMPEPDREIRGGYAGDLLSWVMGRAKSDQVWVTIMSNINVSAVAALTDVAVVVLAEGVQPDPDASERAKEKGINLLGTESSTFDFCLALKDLV